jgi:plastocyanin
VGDTVTWTNNSSVAHNVISRWRGAPSARISNRGVIDGRG